MPCCFSAAREASALYFVHKGEVTLDNVWERMVAEDFRALRRAGLARPMMREVEVALGVAPAKVRESANASALRAGKP